MATLSQLAAPRDGEASFWSENGTIPLGLPGAYESGDSFADRSPPGNGEASSDPRKTSHRWTSQEPTKVAAVSQIAAPQVEQTVLYSKRVPQPQEGWRARRGERGGGRGGRRRSRADSALFKTSTSTAGGLGNTGGKKKEEEEEERRGGKQEEEGGRRGEGRGRGGGTSVFPRNILHNCSYACFRS